MLREVALNIWLCGVIYSGKFDLNITERSYNLFRGSRALQRILR